eukprot:284818836_5
MRIKQQAPTGFAEMVQWSRSSSFLAAMASGDILVIRSNRFADLSEISVSKLTRYAKQCRNLFEGKSLQLRSGCVKASLAAASGKSHSVSEIYEKPESYFPIRYSLKPSFNLHSIIMAISGFNVITCRFSEMFPPFILIPCVFVDDVACSLYFLVTANFFHGERMFLFASCLMRISRSGPNSSTWHRHRGSNRFVLVIRVWFACCGPVDQVRGLSHFYPAPVVIAFISLISPTFLSRLQVRKMQLSSLQTHWNCRRQRTHVNG